MQDVAVVLGEQRHLAPALVGDALGACTTERLEDEAVAVQEETGVVERPARGERALVRAVVAHRPDAVAAGQERRLVHSAEG